MHGPMNIKKYIKLMYLTFMHCTCKFEEHKQSFLKMTRCTNLMQQIMIYYHK